MKKRLFKGMLIISFLLITFFSIKLETYAAGFAYDSFKWEEFLEQNKAYWVSSCDEGDENCYDRIIKTQKKFYTHLYKMLAKYEKKGYKIDDNIIIETVFYGLTPDSFKDPEYDGKTYNIDDTNAVEKYIAGENIDEIAADYFKNESDTIKTLLNAMIGYTQKCYGVTDVVPIDDGNGNKLCGDNLTYIDGSCVEHVETLKSNFMATNFIGKLFGVNKSNDKECVEKASEKGYSSIKLGEVNKDSAPNLDMYWDYLIHNEYFDNKPHLSSYFRYILEDSGYKSMKELSKSSDYEKYEEDIIKARTRIVKNIESILDSYGEFTPTPDSASFRNVFSTNYWWPIGSSEVTEVDGVQMALGEPETVSISSYYGLRTNPVSGQSNTNHKGIDIPGTNGVTNVIAVRDGVVVTAPDTFGGSCQEGDTDCGGGFGNYVIIQHVDGNYTVYAHMAQNSVTVKNGDNVKQGQVIGKVGHTGSSTGPHLHFEVRVGGMDSNSTKDPLNYISVDSPRSSNIIDDLYQWLGVMEGTGPMEGDNYIVYLDSVGVATFGHGIAITHQKDIIRSFGLDPDSLTVGTKVSKSIADEIYMTIKQRFMDGVKQIISNKGYIFTDNQIAALTSLAYNAGMSAINDFLPKYEQYGSSESLCTNWWNTYKIKNGPGLAERRPAECDAFVNGYYNMNPYG